MNKGVPWAAPAHAKAQFMYHAIAHPGIQYQTMSLSPQPVLLSAVPSHTMQNYGEPYTAPANVKPW